jgi:hypothetical protein
MKMDDFFATRINDGCFQSIMGSGYGSSSSSSLVLDRERGELVEAAVKLERKGVSPERSIEALKNHSEAERRRRARINSHLDTLRSVIPGANKVSFILFLVFDYFELQLVCAGFVMIEFKCLRGKISF